MNALGTQGHLQPRVLGPRRQEASAAHRQPGTQSGSFIEMRLLLRAIKHYVKDSEHLRALPSFDK